MLRQRFGMKVRRIIIAGGSIGGGWWGAIGGLRGLGRWSGKNKALSIVLYLHFYHTGGQYMKNKWAITNILRST